MKKMGMRGRHVLAGWMFAMPWLIGLLVFFIQPVGSFFRWSFSTFNMGTGDGYQLVPNEGGIFQHYIEAWTKDVKYGPAFTGAFEYFLYSVPVIVVFSLFCALLLNQDFKGRAIMRAVFFLPIIVTSGVFGLITTRGMALADSSAVTAAASSDGTMFDVSLLVTFLIESGLPAQLVETLAGVVSDVAYLIWQSGVQILIFLIGLLAIPESYYEAAKVEGATAWEAFWKITFPVVSPFILANLVYTFITSCMGINSGVLLHVSTFTGSFNYSPASAMMWMYFFTMLIIVMIIYGVGSKLMVSSR